MGTEKTRKSVFGLQYSLRGMLIATALVGVGLVVYRWPFTEKEVFTDPLGYTETRIETYRRQWDGSVVKHGLTKFGPMEEFYVDGIKVWEAQFTPQGNLRFKQHFAGGKQHGPFYDQEGKIQGQFHDGLRTGVWNIVQSYGEETVLSRRAYDQGVAHGEWRWSAGDKMLQSATFNHGRLTHWNGRPASEELARVLESKKVDSITREVLATRIELVDLEHSVWHGGVAFEWPIANSPNRLVLQFSMMEPGVRYVPKVNEPARAAAEAFLEQALLNSQTLDYRFGVVCFVPIAEYELRGEDRSGVSQIHFEPGSPEEKAWLEPISVSQDINSAAPQRLQQLFAGTPIEIDASAFPMQSGVQLPTLPSRSPGREISSYRRPRRDVVGLLLLARGWTLHQKGNRLEIVPKSSG